MLTLRSRPWRVIEAALIFHKLNCLLVLILSILLVLRLIVDWRLIWFFLVEVHFLLEEHPYPFGMILVVTQLLVDLFRDKV